MGKLKDTDDLSFHKVRSYEERDSYGKPGQCQLDNGSWVTPTSGGHARDENGNEWTYVSGKGYTSTSVHDVDWNKHNKK